MSFFKTNLTEFGVDTLFLNEHAKLKNKTKLKKKTKNKFILKKTSVKTLLNEIS